MKLYLTVFLRALVGLRSTVSQLTARSRADIDCYYFTFNDVAKQRLDDSRLDAYNMAFLLEGLNMIMDRMGQTDVDDAIISARIDWNCREYFNGGTSDYDFKLSSTQLTDQDCGLLKIYADTMIACENNFISLSFGMEMVCFYIGGMEPDEVNYAIEIATTTECYNSEASNGGTSPDEHSPAPSLKPTSNIIPGQATPPPLQLTDDMDCNMLETYANYWIASGNGAYDLAISLESVSVNMNENRIEYTTVLLACEMDEVDLSTAVEDICIIMDVVDDKFFLHELKHGIKIASTTVCPPPPPDDIALEVTPPTDPPKLSSF
jgi:hypothetical protein